MGRLIFSAPRGQGILAEKFSMTRPDREPGSDDGTNHRQPPRWNGDEMTRGQRAPETQKKEDPLAGELLR